MRLNLAMLYVKDLPRMTAFYADTLGLRPIDGTVTDTYLELSSGEVRLALHAIPAHIAEQFEITAPPQPREETPIKLMFEVDDLPAESLRLEALGVSITRRPWGTCDVIDPEGNIFQLYSASK